VSGVEHLYTSTACQHGRHNRCRRQCKFCDARCLCPCHAFDGVEYPASESLADSEADIHQEGRQLDEPLRWYERDFFREWWAAFLRLFGSR
jgi:hypothetical protein